MRKDVRGFTLMELMVVVAILGICAALVSLSIAPTLSARAKKCAEFIDAALSTCKVSALSEAGPVYLTLYTDGDNLVAEFHSGAKSSTETVAASKVQVTYTTQDGTARSLGTVDAPLYLSFDRETGGLLTLKTAAGFVTADTDGIPDQTLKAIAVTLNRTYVIQIAATTGYHGIGG